VLVKVSSRGLTKAFSIAARNPSPEKSVSITPLIKNVGVASTRSRRRLPCRGARRFILGGIKLSVELFAIQSGLTRILLERIAIERVLVLEQQIDVLPEFPCALAASAACAAL